MICFSGDLKVLKVIVTVVFIFCSIDSVLGRKCVCTSKACKESGAKTCRTRFSCYTELIYSAEAAAPGAAIKTTRGCTEGATPLLCETKTWRASDEQDSSSSNSLEQLGRVAWPRLSCCDDRDYCNAADEDFETTSVHPEERDSTQDNTSKASLHHAYDYHARSSPEIDNVRVNQNVQNLHVAALVLAIAALISVFAACYVVTRTRRVNQSKCSNQVCNHPSKHESLVKFLNASGANSGIPRILSPYGNGMDV